MFIREGKLTDFVALNYLYKLLDDVHHQHHPDIFQEIHEEFARPKEYIKELITNPNKLLLVCEYQDNVIGFAEAYKMRVPSYHVFQEREWVHIDSIAVKKEHRHKQVGTMLLQEVINWGKTMGMNRLELTVYNFNTQAEHFYRTFGFSVLHQVMYFDGESS
ncbi:N-acetyltransferase family protein [Evansella sp. AB-rgal1]|uniref:GNAT family N-acetyltransferase n=1 Tax=Evansella sp. AB-rgal1 TaxID=3242696 RepID=UPI00359EE905